MYWIRCLFVYNISTYLLALAGAATQGGKMLSLCVVFQYFPVFLVCTRHWCICGNLQSIGLVPLCPLHEQPPLTSVEPGCLGRTMPKAQREIRCRRFQATVNLHPSFLHGEHSQSGFGTQVCELQHNRNQKLLFPISRALISTYLCFIAVHLGHCLVLCNLESFLLVYPQTYLFTCFSSLAACHQLTWPYSLASLLPSCPLKPLYRGCSFVVKIWNLELHLLQHRPPLCVHQMYRIDFAFIFCMPKYFYIQKLVLTAIIFEHYASVWPHYTWAILLPF